MEATALPEASNRNTPYDMETENLRPRPHHADSRKITICSRQVYKNKANVQAWGQVSGYDIGNI